MCRWSNPRHVFVVCCAPFRPWWVKPTPMSSFLSLGCASAPVSWLEKNCVLVRGRDRPWKSDVTVPPAPHLSRPHPPWVPSSGRAADTSPRVTSPGGRTAAPWGLRRSVPAARVLSCSCPRVCSQLGPSRKRLPSQGSRGQTGAHPALALQPPSPLPFLCLLETKPLASSSLQGPLRFSFPGPLRMTAGLGPAA